MVQTQYISYILIIQSESMSKFQQQKAHCTETVYPTSHRPSLFLLYFVCPKSFTIFHVATSISLTLHCTPHVTYSQAPMLGHNRFTIYLIE